MGLRKALGKVSGAANGLVAKGAYWMAGRYIRAAAEGKYGPGWQKTYLALQGKKTLLGLALTLAALVCAEVGAPDAATWFTGGLAGVLVGGGLIDKAWRDDLSWRAQLRGYPWYRWLAEHSAVNTVVLATAWAFVQAGECTPYMECATASKALLGLAAAAVYLGLVDAAWLATPPAIQPKKANG